jgi:hypothetical protein
MTTKTPMTTGMSINTSTGLLARRRAPARHVRALLTALSDRLHAPDDERARAAGWTVTVVHGPFGLNGRSYRDPRFGPERGGDRHA